MDRPDSAALAEDLLGRTVLPRLLRTLLNVEDVIKDMPEVEALAGDVTWRRSAAWYPGAARLSGESP